MKWIRDEEFIRGNIPMTKFNIRALAIAHLEIEKGDRLIDIGAGTGSISIEAAAQGASVLAIERSEEGASLIRENMEKFNLKIDVIHGQAPDDLEDRSFNKAFIGGSRGQLKSIFDYLEDNLESSGILLANFIMLKNLNEFIELMKKYNYRDLETHMVQASYVDRLGLLKGQNPIFIVKGVKK